MLETAADPGRLKPAAYERVRKLVYEKAGIDLRQGKEELVSARLAKKLREGKFSSYEEYLDQVAADKTGESLTALIDVLTTNFTSFLREPAHFAFLREKVFPTLASRGNIELWCAAAATGEEPYSLIFTMVDAFGAGRVKLLATDISTRALVAARTGIYPADRLKGVPNEWLSKYFLRGHGDKAGLYQVRPEIARLIEFRSLNLISAFQHSRSFPLISCRNVMIYFDRPTQERAVNRMAQFLEPGGHLFVGHSESLTGFEQPLHFVQPAIYQMPAR
jgi:chemotaxis protein methyltransferase CheR